LPSVLSPKGIDRAVELPFVDSCHHHAPGCVVEREANLRILSRKCCQRRDQPALIVTGVRNDFHFDDRNELRHCPPRSLRPERIRPILRAAGEEIATNAFSKIEIEGWG
jgi:hypothetical protein